MNVLLIALSIGVLASLIFILILLSKIDGLSLQVNCLQESRNHFFDRNKDFGKRIFDLEKQVISLVNTEKKLRNALVISNEKELKLDQDGNFSNPTISGI